MTFEDDLENSLKTYESLIRGFAARTREMINRDGRVEALSRLVLSANLQNGFKILRDKDMLYFTFEAVITRHKYLFTAEALEAATWRLEHASNLPNK